MDTSKKRWFEGLQTLRALLFIVVFISHSGSFFPTFGEWGGVAVYVFFVLSGFLAAVNFNKEKFKENGIIKSCCLSLYKRIKKYYPLYFIFLLVAIPINFQGWRIFLKCVLLIQSYFFNVETALSLNWPCWFLSSMMICFFLSPFMCYLSEKLKNKSKTLLIVVLFIVLNIWGMYWNTDMIQNSTGMGYYFVYLCPFIRLFDFLTGILFGQLYMSTKLDRVNNDIVDLSILGCFLLHLLLYKKLPVGVQYTSACMPVTLGLIWVFAKNYGSIQKLTKNNFLQHMGNISYELFIVHRLMLVRISQQSISIVNWCFGTLLIFIVAELGHRIMNFNGSIIFSKYPYQT